MTVCASSLVTEVLDSDILGSEFELQTYCYVYFWTNALGKDMNPLFTPAIV